MTRYILLITFALSFISCNINQDNFRVSSSSMKPNFEEGDIVKVNKGSDAILNYGDLIACHQKGLWPDVDAESVLFARIVGLPGDSIRVIHDICEINGHKNPIKQIGEPRLLDSNIYNEYEETFPNGKIVRILHRPDLERDEFITKKILVPAGHYFVMGDNRSNSYDSRWVGTVPQEKIIGRVIETTSTN